MKKYTKEELALVLEKHAKWLRHEEGGERANLSYANLYCANLSHTNLRYANLRYANLSHANLSHANLRHANLRYANLSHANLSSTKLYSTNLGHADLSSTNLRYANLSHANLRYANLQQVSGYKFCQTSWDSHGECGRMLTGIIINDEKHFFCGCFNGNLDDLQKYIENGSDKLKESRTIVLDFVNACLNKSLEK